MRALTLSKLYMESKPHFDFLPLMSGLIIQFVAYPYSTFLSF